MFINFFENANPSKEPKHKEGELYKVITAYGRSFEIYYGYYEEIDRLNPLCDPMEIYPDFKKSPIHTDEGLPFVTAMQEGCECYRGDSNEGTCYQCSYYENCDELLGVCKCPARRKR